MPSAIIVRFNVLYFRYRSEELYIGAGERGVHPVYPLVSWITKYDHVLSFVLQLISLAGLHSTAVATGMYFGGFVRVSGLSEIYYVQRNWQNVSRRMECWPTLS